MRESEWCRKCLEMGSTGRKTLVYSLLCEPDSRTRSGESFGVGILILESGERERIADITGSLDEAEGLLECISENAVTPISLRDVVMDWLCR